MATMNTISNDSNQFQVYYYFTEKMYSTEMKAFVLIGNAFSAQFSLLVFFSLQIPILYHHPERKILIIAGVIALRTRRLFFLVDWLGRPFDDLDKMVKVAR